LLMLGRAHSDPALNRLPCPPASARIYECRSGPKDASRGTLIFHAVNVLARRNGMKFDASKPPHARSIGPTRYDRPVAVDGAGDCGYGDSRRPRSDSVGNVVWETAGAFDLRSIRSPVDFVSLAPIIENGLGEEWSAAEWDEKRLDPCVRVGFRVGSRPPGETVVPVAESGAVGRPVAPCDAEVIRRRL